MSHHLVTVCMFCLLCAAHTSCGSHLDRSQERNDVHNEADTLRIPFKDEAKIVTTHDIEESGQGEGRKKNLEYSARYMDKMQKIRAHRTQGGDRTKRESTTDIKNVVPNAFVENIFDQYGDVASMTMNLTGFNLMLQRLYLDRLIDGGLEKSVSKNYIYPQNKEEDVYCVSSGQLVSTINSRLKKEEAAHSHEDHHEPDVIISERTFQSLCPILLYQKMTNTSLEQAGCVKENTNYRSRRTHLKTSSSEPQEGGEAKNMYSVWLYSSLSITAISACGLLGVAVIPIMHKTYYNHIIQFLVALAVGTLCGDALLHLMPHAMSPLDHDHEHGGDTAPVPSSHDDGMWKGLAAMLGVVFFYFTEKGLTVVVEWRKRRQKMDKENKLPARVRVLKDDSVCGGSNGSNRPAPTGSSSLLKIFKKGDKSDPTTKLCKHKYSEYPYCYDEIDTDTHDEHHHRDGQVPSSQTNNTHNPVSIVSSNVLNAEGKDNEPTAKDWLLNAESTPTVVEMNNVNHKEDPVKEPKDGDSYTVILREHSRAHHGHSHSHGHVHAPPSSMSSVAWMVIMGDGLHNFTDGMAIGAAFASNIAGGFSTAIAVLCHELPHELGDFAVLLKAGMSVKRAVWYNVLSSALCLAGMVCGVLAGHAPSATRWLFAVAAGMFLYIALVDMMPELSTSHSNEGTLFQCALQLMGLATGIGIMLVIALYEEDMKTLFS